MQSRTDEQSVSWTLVVRLTHWLVAAGVLINMINDTGYVHRLIGYICVALILIRLWHAIRPNVVESSRLYLPTFEAIKQHLSEIQTGEFSQHYGHNPLGQLAVYLIWLLIGLLAITGWLSRTDAYWGEDWPVDWHEYISNTLMCVVAVHIFAVFIMSRLQKRNLIKQMLTGKTEIDKDDY